MLQPSNRWLIRQQKMLVATTDVGAECEFSHSAARCCSGETYRYETPTLGGGCMSGGRASRTWTKAIGMLAARADAVTEVSIGSDQRGATRRSSTVSRTATA